MILQKKLLLNSLKNCLSGIDSGSSAIQGADSFIFYNGNIVSCNDTISVSVPFSQAGIDEEIEGVVKAKEFYDVINKMPNDEIEFLVEENCWVIKSGKAKAKLVLLDIDYKMRLDGINKVSDDEYIEISDDYKAAFNTCNMTNKSNLGGVYVDKDVVMSAHSWCINQYLTDTELPKFWLSEKAVNEILKFNFNKVCVNNNWVHFKNDDEVTFSVKSLNVDNYPFAKISAVMKADITTDNDIKVELPQELFSAIERATSFSNDTSGHKLVQLNFKKEGIEVKAERVTGSYDEMVSWNEETDLVECSAMVDSDMMKFIEKRSLDCYLKLKEGVVKKFLFVTDVSYHLVASFND